MIAFAIMFVAIVVYNLIGSNPSKSGDYVLKIESVRKDRDYFYKNSEKSPIQDRQNFKGLNYFPIDEKFKVKARIELIDNQEVIELPTSQDKPDTYLKFAWAVFELQGNTHRLLLLRKDTRTPQLFLAFRDETSGKTTYGGGRYLDIPYQRGENTFDLDFNLAYHPYCVFNEKYVCPLPPLENQLKIAIAVGERLK
jgi:uncharacterized protein (DUF1684 family)